MQSLSQTFSSVSVSDPALWLALGAGLAVLLSFLFLGRRGHPRGRGPIVLPTQAAGSADWESLPAARADERRRAIRRGGLPTPILIVDPKAGRRAKALEAYVLDRSTGGLRLALEKPVNVGGTLLAKPGNAPDGFEWVKVLIRNCREVGDYYEVGCQFETELELNRLLMFG
jgi:PilZ domain